MGRAQERFGIFFLDTHGPHQNPIELRGSTICLCKNQNSPVSKYHRNPRETFIFRGYNPYFGGGKAFIFHGFGVQG